MDNFSWSKGFEDLEPQKNAEKRFFEGVQSPNLFHSKGSFVQQRPKFV